MRNREGEFRLRADNKIEIEKNRETLPSHDTQTDISNPSVPQFGSGSLKLVASGSEDRQGTFTFVVQRKIGINRRINESVLSMSES